MERLNLPICSAATSISTALAQLHESRRSAVAVFDRNDFGLITVDEMAAARWRGFQSLAAVSGVVRLPAAAPLDIWMEPDAAITYQVRLGQRNLNLLAAHAVTPARIRSFMESQLLGTTGLAQVDWHLIGRVAQSPSNARPSVLDDIVTGRFDHPLADVWVPRDVRTLLGAPPRDYYCTGEPRHNSFPGIVREGDDCPYDHPPAMIVSSR